MVFFAFGFGSAMGAGSTLAGAASTFWLSFTRTVGAENVKPFADRVSHPSLSLTTVVATWEVPSEEIIETEAEIGAFENP